MKRSERPGSLRLRIVLLVVMAIVLSFVVRLVDIQVVEAGTFDAQSHSVETVSSTLSGNRGAITDRTGVVLAGDVTRYDITTAPRDVHSYVGTLGRSRSSKISPAAALAAVARATGGSERSFETTIRSHPHADFASLVTGLDLEHYRSVERLHIPWIYAQAQAQRVYPSGADSGNVTGFLGTDGPQAGLEYAYDDCLRASNGSETYERGGDGVPLPGSTRIVKKQKDGGTLQTTIDRDLEYEGEQTIATAATALHAQSATASVLDARTGAVRALDDWPTVDPDNVTPTAQDDPAALGSQALTAAYEPGSTIKAIIAAALIQTGNATPTTQAVVPSTRRFPWGGAVSDAEVHPTEDLTLTGILARSSNVGITLLGQRLSAQSRFDYMKKFGLFQSDTAIRYPGQPTWPSQTSPAWDEQTNVNSMFGQGITATALQVAGVYQTLANGGVRIPPHIVTGCTLPSGKVIDRPDVRGTRVVSASTADQVVDMLQDTTKASDGGTLANMVPIPGYDIALKTGTAQIALPHGQGYGPDTVISVEAMVPAQHPRYVVSVAFTKPQTSRASSAAAPAIRSLITQVLQRYRIPPSSATGTTYPSQG